MFAGVGFEPTTFRLCSCEWSCPVHVVAARNDACGEIETGPGGVGKGLIADDDGGAGEKGRQGFGKPDGEIEARLTIT